MTADEALEHARVLKAAEELAAEVRRLHEAEPAIRDELQRLASEVARLRAVVKRVEAYAKGLESDTLVGMYEAINNERTAKELRALIASVWDESS